MNTFNRRAVVLGSVATGVLALQARAARGESMMALMNAPGATKSTIAPGIVMRAYGEHVSLIPGYKTVKLIDFIMAPGSKTPDDPMPNAMVCHMLAGELHVVQNGVASLKKTNDVWTCATGTHEVASNESKASATMRMTFLIPA